MRPVGLVCTLCLLVVVSSRRSHGDDNLLVPSPESVQLPLSNQMLKGFTATVAVADQEIVGMIPVEIDVIGMPRFSADRQLVFRFRNMDTNHAPPRNTMVIDVPITASQGQASVKVVKYLPKWTVGNGYFVSVLEDGLALPDYAGAIASGRPSQFSSNQAGALVIPTVFGPEKAGNWLYVSDSKVILNAERRATTQRFDPLLKRRWPLEQKDSMRLASFNEVPEDWRGLQAFDVVVLNLESVDALRTRPKAFAALRQWMLLGGVVIADNVASGEELSEWLDIKWTGEASERESVDAIANAMTAIALRAGVGANVSRIYHSTPRELSKRVFVQRVGAGKAIGVVESQPKAAEFGMRVASEIVGHHRSPMLRRGADPMLGDGRYYRWLVPGVAQPPVYTFIGLLTVFVILVGPIAYRKTAKQGRSHLMFAIAPLLAMVTTLSMFAYGIIADGFGTVARVRQLTWVDGKSGDAGERVRATYFAGIRPSQGIRFPANAEVVEHRRNGGENWMDACESPLAVAGQVTLGDDFQVFGRSFLPSRQQRQFVTHQPRDQVGSVSFDPATGVITNGTAITYHQIVVRDDAGEIWTVEDLGGKRTATAKLLTATEASKLLGKLYIDHRPETAVRESRQTSSNYRVEIRDWMLTLNQEFGDGQRRFTDGLFEQWLLDNLLLNVGDIPNGWFVATADVSDDVLAVESAEVVDSIRYVFGTMK